MGIFETALGAFEMVLISTDSITWAVFIFVVSSTLHVKGSVAFQKGLVGSGMKNVLNHPIASVRNRQPLFSQNNESTSPNESKTKANPGLLRLAELSLKDYDWRSSVFKSKEADRKIEESLARMMGDEPTYVRPMDASEKTIGPLVRKLESHLSQFDFFAAMI